MTTEELQLELLNKLEALARQVEKLNENVKANTNVVVSNTNGVKDLKETVGATNKTFEQVAQYLKDIYVKIQGLEMIQKLMGSLGPMLGKK